MTTTPTQRRKPRFEQHVDGLLPQGDGPFDVTAFELTHDGESWSVNTPFGIGRGLDRADTLRALRSRWEVFKVNYAPKARVCDIVDFGDGFEGDCNLEVDCIAFADVKPQTPNQP